MLRWLWKIKATKQSSIRIACTEGGDFWTLTFACNDPRLNDLETLRKHAVAEKVRGSRRVVYHHVVLSRAAVKKLGQFFYWINWRETEADKIYREMRYKAGKGLVKYGGL